MVNRHRGEIEAKLDGKPYMLCLTLGALAELEAAFGADDMVTLAQRFEQGRVRSLDALRIIGAGLRGAGCELTDEDVAAMRAEGGASGYIDIVARLLRATFSAEETDNDTAERATKRSQEPGPFPGAT
jgi:Phage tail tube protein, GTA-gp10